MKQIDRIRSLVDRITLDFLGTQFQIRVEYDDITLNAYKKLEYLGFPKTVREMREPRVFFQITYVGPDTKSKEVIAWRGGKWFLSEHMTDDEIVKKVYLAFRTCIEHEVLESFKVDGIILFNPHVNFEELLKISHKEVKRN